MRLIFIILVMPVLSFAQLTERPLPATKPYPYPMGYLEHIPKEVTCRKLPILIFCHGIGEGFNYGPLSIVSRTGLPAVIKFGLMPVDSFIVLCPQGPKYISIPALHAFIAYAKKAYPQGDTSRVYLTGLSGGAITGANYCRLYRVKAAVFCAGYPSYKDLCLQQSIYTPMWFFHNKGDATCKYTGDVTFVDLYNKCKPIEPAQLTLYEGGSHNVWDKVYRMAEPYNWLLGHK